MKVIAVAGAVATEKQVVRETSRIKLLYHFLLLFFNAEQCFSFAFQPSADVVNKFYQLKKKKSKHL